MSITITGSAIYNRLGPVSTSTGPTKRQDRFLFEWKRGSDCKLIEMRY